MPRPQKQTVEYFSHDADAGNGRTLSILFNHFGHEGLSAWWLLLERLARTRNHVIAINNGEDTEALAAALHFQPGRLKDILTKMAELGAIDPDLFKHGRIWCQHFVDRLEPVYKYRKQALPTKPELSGIPAILRQAQAQNTELSGKETPLPILETSLLVPKSTQSKESKVKRVKKDPEIHTIFTTWNDRKIIIHKELTKKTKRAIKTALKVSTVDEVCQAIKNYGEILAHPDLYYWSYKWTLADFLGRGMEKFADLEIAKGNYRKAKAGKSSTIVDYEDVTGKGPD